MLQHPLLFFSTIGTRLNNWNWFRQGRDYSRNDLNNSPIDMSNFASEIHLALTIIQFSHYLFSRTIQLFAREISPPRGLQIMVNPNGFVTSVSTKIRRGRTLCANKNANTKLGKIRSAIARAQRSPCVLFWSCAVVVYTEDLPGEKRVILRIEKHFFKLKKF